MIYDKYGIDVKLGNTMDPDRVSDHHTEKYFIGRHVVGKDNSIATIIAEDKQNPRYVYISFHNSNESISRVLKMHVGHGDFTEPTAPIFIQAEGGEGTSFSYIKKKHATYTLTDEVTDEMISTQYTCEDGEFNTGTSVYGLRNTTGVIIGKSVTKSDLHRSIYFVKINRMDKFEVIIKARTSAINKHTFSDPYSTSIANVGYMGVGEYNSISESYIYNNWRRLIGKVVLSDGVLTMDDKWLDFQNFTTWYKTMPTTWFASLNNTILGGKDSTHYGEDTTILLPRAVNAFIKGTYKGDTAIIVNGDGRARVNVKYGSYTKPTSYTTLKGGIARASEIISVVLYIHINAMKSAGYGERVINALKQHKTPITKVENGVSETIEL